LTPFPGPRSVVILDNCAIHHDEEIRQIIEIECGASTIVTLRNSQTHIIDVGAKLIYLPPYSPDFNKPFTQSKLGFEGMKLKLSHQRLGLGLYTRQHFLFHLKVLRDGL